MDHKITDNLAQDNRIPALARQIRKAMKHYRFPVVALGILRAGKEGFVW
ncbi:MAG TPA: hypothetical protein VKF38_02945 [Anaerolineaceae bacterium]|nr:hypothetical protein [Anaerolineaceae bacterium]